MDHRLPGEQCVLLEDHAPLYVGAHNALAVQEAVAAGGLMEARQNVEQRGLAAPGGTHHADELVLHNVQVDPVEGYRGAVISVVLLFHVLDPDLYASSRFSCHDVSLLSMKSTNVFSSVPMMPMRMM